MSTYEFRPKSLRTLMELRGRREPPKRLLSRRVDQAAHVGDSRLHWRGFRWGSLRPEGWYLEDLGGIWNRQPIRWFAAHLEKPGSIMADKVNSQVVTASLVAVVNPETLAEIDRIAAKYGATREEIILELLRLDIMEQSESATVH